MMTNILITIVGLLIYATYGWGGFAYLLLATVVSYVLGLLAPKHRWAMPLGVVSTVLVLLAVKLQPVTGWTFQAALGISYFSLQMISYLVDVRRGKYPPERNFLNYLLFLTYLPHIFLGPIERYDSFSHAAFDQRRISWDGLSGGATRALWGLFKKLAIAARAGVIVGTISADPAQFRGAYAFAAMLLYAVQLYADFSGGIDVVLGVSQMLGIRLHENFQTPYFSESVQEFWRRWHITLGSWLREYVYIPLGGNRKGSVRKLLNTLVTFLVSGLWHGVAYLLWGVCHGVLVACGERLKSRWKWLNQLGTFLIVSLLWSFFIWPDTQTALAMIGSVFTSFDAGNFFAGVGALGLTLGEWLVLAGATGLLWAFDCRHGALADRFHALYPAGRLAVMGALALLILIFGMYGIGFNAEAFIYSRF